MYLLTFTEERMSDRADTQAHEQASKLESLSQSSVTLPIMQCDVLVTLSPTLKSVSFMLQKSWNKPNKRQ